MPPLRRTIRRPSARALAVGALTLVVAWLSAWAALSLALTDQAPQLGARSPIAAGPATAKLARLDVALSVDPNKVDPSNIFPKTIPASAVRMARKGFEMEPLSQDALAVLALDANARGDAARARALFHAANRLSRRNSLASTWLAEKAVESRDIDATLLHFDEILRTNDEGRATVLERFAAATPDPVFARALAKLLRADPPWAAEFWQTAPTVVGAVDSVARLRLQLTSSGLKFDRADDSALAERLIETGGYDLAGRLYRSLSPPSDLAGGERVRDAQFARSSVLPPVDWNVSSTGDYGAEINIKAGALLFSATTSARAPVARQWIGLPPGRYLLRTKLAYTEQGGEGGTVIARLSCIGDETFRDFNLKTGSAMQPFAVGPGDCGNYWLDILVTPGEGSSGLDGSLDYISIKPA